MKKITKEQFLSLLKVSDSYTINGVRYNTYANFKDCITFAGDYCVPYTISSDQLNDLMLNGDTVFYYTGKQINVVNFYMSIQMPPKMIRERLKK